MIATLRGKLTYSDKENIVVECGGIGFKCAISLNTLAVLPPVDNDIFVFTYMSVKEDAMDLFAFSTADELECFKLLITVSGVGPKMCISLLSEFKPDRLFLAIASGDYKSLTAASGVGPKLAQRIILELKDKVGSLPTIESTNVSAVANIVATSNTKEAISALVSLGFSQSEAASAVSKLDPSLSTEELIKSALKNLSRQV